VSPPLSRRTLLTGSAATAATAAATAATTVPFAVPAAAAAFILGNVLMMIPWSVF